MKRISILFVLFIFACSMAQAQSLSNFNSKPAKASDLPQFANDYVRLAPDNHVIGANTNKSGLDMIMGSDTLYQYFKRSTNYTTYSITISGNNYPFTGYNGLYVMLGSRFKTSSEVKVERVLIAFSWKQMVGSDFDTIPVYVIQCDDTYDLPTGTTIAAGFPLLNQLDTTSSQLTFTSIPIVQSTGATSKNFAVMLLTYTGTSEYDATAILSNLQGDGKGEKNTVVIYPQDSKLYVATFADYFSSVQMDDEGNPPDFDVMIIPIVSSGTPNEVNDGKLSFEGVTLNSATPNPASDNVNLDLTLEKSSDVTVHLVDLQGRVVKSITRKGLNAGSHNFSFDLKDLASGAYYYTVITDFTKFGGSLNIVK